MSDRRLKVFHTVAKLLSFTKAAEALHMTQPAVTFQVRQLEEYFNTRLFDRTHNKVNLTPAGERVAEFAERIFDLYSEMENSVRDLTGEISGALTIGASTTIAEYMLPALLGEFKTRYPEVNLRLKVSNSEGIVSMVEHNVIDLGVVESPVSNKNLIVEVCHDDQLVVIAAPDHELVKRGGPVMAGEIVKYPFISREEGSGTREVIMQYLMDENVNPNEMNLSLELGSPEAIKGAVEAGMGITIISRSIIDKELKLNTLCELQLDPPLSRPFSFVRQRQKFRVTVMEELLDFAQTYFKKNK
ncbi:MAG: LysR family transcriptional regulator [Gammaproteobacteria bacterium]|nr:MAG: LysR family transcriptional regulator [Gammaproteobacteria bacterium]UCH38942.1 MAG: LysR family transcriptional regulator [Gammaproteobacteria bacterium]